MAWTDSRIFTQALLNPIMGRSWTTAAPTTFSSLSADTIKAALFGTAVTPDRDAAVGSTGYNTGTWTTGNEITGGAGWPAGGVALTSKAFAAGVSIVNFDAADTPSSGNVTIAAAFGDMVYDDTITAGTVAKQGLCFNYFGGTQSVTAGLFTIIWDATGVLKVTN